MRVVIVAAVPLLLTGCILSQVIIGDRETISKDSAYVGYWIDTPDAEGKSKILSVFYENANSLIVISAKKAYASGEIKAYKDISMDEATIARVYLSKKQGAGSALGIIEGFATIEYLNNPNMKQYELGKYQLFADGTLALYYADQLEFKAALEQGLVTANDYEPVSMTLKLSSEKLADFVNQYKGFLFAGGYRKLQMSAAEVNANIGQLSAFYFKSVEEQKLAQLKAPLGNFSQSMGFNTQAVRPVVAAYFYDASAESRYEVSYWPDLKFSDIAQDSNLLKQWVDEWGKSAGMQSPKFVPIPAQGVPSMISIGGVHSKELNMRAMVINDNGRICIVKQSWPSYRSTNAANFEPLKNIVGQVQAR